VVARAAEGRGRRIHVVERQRGGGQARRSPQQPEVGEEAVALQWKRAASAAVAWKVEHRAAVVAAHPPGQAAVALAKQRVDDARGNDSFWITLFGIRGTGRTGGADGHHRAPAIGQLSAALAAATAPSTTAASVPIALMTPR
jgi:hypothetical protein